MSCLDQLDLELKDEQEYLSEQKKVDFLIHNPGFEESSDEAHCKVVGVKSRWKH